MAGHSRYAIVGVGARSRMYQEALQQRSEAGARLVACADVNPGRLRLSRDWAVRSGQPEPELYPAAAFEDLLACCKPARVIVTTPDHTHADYVARALLAGADVIVEKPMAIDETGCRRILEAVSASGKRCTVTFNYRYSPVRSQVKELLMSGVIGEVLSVDFHWMLDTFHGADYFRRWHSHKACSGGLLVHKATHHFDLVNWWLSALPTSVLARGRRRFYRGETAARLGLHRRGERCLDCREKTACAFALQLADEPELRSLYLDQERHDGYLRDRCVFRSDIDIEDTLHAIVQYDTGATLSYSLNAFCSWEGYTITFNGSLGRIEHRVVENTPSTPHGDSRGAIVPRGSSISVHPLRGAAYAVEPRRSAGGHGGGDALLLRDVLDAPAPDPLLRAADERSGAFSILVGVAANRSMQTGSQVRIADLVPAIRRPDYPEMPGAAAPLKLAP